MVAPTITKKATASNSAQRIFGCFLGFPSLVLLFSCLEVSLSLLGATTVNFWWKWFEQNLARSTLEGEYFSA